ncbi:PP2C family protein-serine/threonine phosphatase [Streptomyces mirabilis]|uniref:PP2C family protein-serine/threonine phosphatase n=1 Tax=Streptomyces mirabilis TaxID=68239 RepID=UPI00369BD0B0
MTALVTIMAVWALMAICLVRNSVNPPQVAALIATSVAVTIARYLAEHRQRKLVQLRAVAETAQRAVLPPLPRRLGPLRLASVYLAAEEEAHIGGDFYAGIRTPTGTRLIIGDVRGKGLPAVGGAAHIIGTFRDAARRQATLPELAAYLDSSVRSDAPEAVAPEQAEEVFATAVILEIPDDEPLMRSVTCGHPPPLLLRANDVATLEAGQPVPPLGLGTMARTTYHLDTFSLRAKDTVLLYTDGAIEARNADGAFYPLAKRLTPQKHRHPAALLNHVHGDPSATQRVRIPQPDRLRTRPSGRTHHGVGRLKDLHGARGLTDALGAGPQVLGSRTRNGDPGSDPRRGDGHFGEGTAGGGFHSHLPPVASAPDCKR